MNHHAAEQGITVTGEGRVRAAPDRATLDLGVSALRKSVAEAREQAARTFQAVLDALSAVGVATGDIQTRRVSVSPEFDYDKGKQRPRGFRVTNALHVTLRDLDRTGEIIDAALVAGGDEAVLNGISFDVEDAKALEDQACEAAVANARHKAETLARAAGVRLGAATRILEQASSSGGPLPRMLMARTADIESTPTPVAPGEVEVSVELSVTWAIASG